MILNCYGFSTLAINMEKRLLNNSDNKMINSKIEKKVIIITGGAGGIAIATTKVLLEHGAKYIALFDLKGSENHAQKYIEKLKKEFENERLDFYGIDVTNHQQFTESYNKVLKSQGSVDILINTAGICNEKNVDLIVDINLKATVKCTLTAIEKMGIHCGGAGGTVINLSSIAGLTYYSQLPVYTATKYAIVGFTGSLKDHYDSIGVRIMAICPGATRTPLLQNLVPLDFINMLTPETYLQSSESVGLAIVKLIEKGQPGDIWVVEKDELPYAVKEPTPYQDRHVSVS